MTRLCSIAGCENKHSAKGFCRLHYLRMKFNGSAAGSSRSHAPLEVRFWRYVDKRGDDECWPWVGKRQPTGYGRIGEGQYKQHGAHRVSFKMANGFEPPVVMHTCDNRWCVNPAHLKAGTYAENNADMRAKGRHNTTERPRGADHHRAKLTEADVRIIKSRPTEKPGKLGAEFGVKSAVIQRIRNGTAWKHVT